MNKNLNRYFTKEDGGMVNKIMKWCSLVTGVMQIKIIRGYHSIPITRDKIKNTNNIKYHQEYGVNGTLID